MFVGDAVSERPLWAKNLALLASTTLGSIFVVIEMLVEMLVPKIGADRGKGAGFGALRGGGAALGNVGGGTALGKVGEALGKVATIWTSSMAATRGPGGLPTGLAFGKPVDTNPAGSLRGLPSFFFIG